MEIAVEKTQGLSWGTVLQAPNSTQPTLMLIINADDLGRSEAETDAALTCFHAGRITSASLMVFMRDSERAARLAQVAKLDVGLHLNFTEPFSATGCSSRLVAAQTSLARFLRRNRYAQLVYNPALRKQFAESYDAQTIEFARLFGGAPPSHVDGHHHMHLCGHGTLGLRRHLVMRSGRGLAGNSTGRVVWLIVR